MATRLPVLRNQNKCTRRASVPSITFAIGANAFFVSVRAELSRRLMNHLGRAAHLWIFESESHGALSHVDSTRASSGMVRVRQTARQFVGSPLMPELRPTYPARTRKMAVVVRNNRCAQDCRNDRPRRVRRPLSPHLQTDDALGSLPGEQRETSGARWFHFRAIQAFRRAARFGRFRPVGHVGLDR